MQYPVSKVILKRDLRCWAECCAKACVMAHSALTLLHVNIIVC